MTITPITNDFPPCFGVMCHQHGQCARYHSVEVHGSARAIGDCHQGRPEWPLFVQVEKEAS